MNSLTPPLINSPITDSSFGRGILLYRVEKSSESIGIALFLKFILFIALMTVLLFQTDQTVITSE